jgi:hypothetical protein
MKQMQQMLESVIGGGGEHNRTSLGAPRTLTREEVNKFQGWVDTVGTALPGPLSLMTTISSGLIDFEKAKEDDLGFKGFLGNLLGEDIASALGLPTSKSSGDFSPGRYGLAGDRSGDQTGSRGGGPGGPADRGSSEGSHGPGAGEGHY